MKLFGQNTTFSLFLAFILFPWFATGANLQSSGSGSWTDPSTWGGATPGTGDNVTILPGDTVFVPDNALAISINNLTIQAGAELVLGKFVFDVTGSANIHGRMRDPERDGFTTFKNAVTFHPGSVGRFVRSFGNGGGMVFENGIINNADSLLFRKVVFAENDQSVIGNSLLVVEEVMEIADNITLTNASVGGIWFDDANMTGQGNNATFKNETLLRYDFRFAMMPVGQVDFATPGNEVVYAKRSDAEIRDAVYARLIIKPDTNGFFRNRYMIGDVTVNEYFSLEPNARLEPKIYNLTVNGHTDLMGRFNDPDAPGINTFNTMTFGGDIDGDFNGYGTVLINGDLDVVGTPADLTEANLVISGTTTIKAGATLEINTNEGPRVFNDMLIEPGATFNSKSDNDVVLAGDVVNDGSFYWKFGTLSGTIEHQGDTAWINKFEVEGTQAEITGNQPVWIQDQIIISPASIITMNNSAGIFLYDKGDLIGLAESSVFRNQGIFHNQTDNALMETGVIDSDYPGAVFYYDRQGNQGQKLSPGSYYDLIVLGGVEGNSRKVTFPTTDTSFVSHLFHIQEYVKFEPQTSSLICTGHTILKNSEIFDGDTEGIYEFTTIDASGAKFSGGGETFGSYLIQEEFSVESGDFEMQNGNISVLGLTQIFAGQELRVTTKSGHRDFGNVSIPEGGSFFDDTKGDTLYFSGLVEVRGQFKADFPLFMGELWVGSDTTNLLKPIFMGSTQITGTHPLRIPSDAVIMPQSQLTNLLDSLIFEDLSTFEGIDSTSVFVNQGTMVWENNYFFLNSGKLDCSTTSNTIVYRFRKGDLEIRPGTYWDLVFVTDPERDLPKRRATIDGFTCLGDLVLQDNVELQPEKSMITVEGTSYIAGKIYDDEPDGLFATDSMVLENALIDGQSSARFGRFMVEHELMVPQGESDWVKAHLTVLGRISVMDSAILNLNTNVGDRSFNNLYVGEGALLDENGEGQSISFDGFVDVQGGTIDFSFGTYQFGGKVRVGEGGAFQSNRSGSEWNFADTVEVWGSGTMQVPNGSLAFSGPAIGDGSLVLEGNLLIAANDTLTNYMTGDQAFQLRGTLNGVNESAHFFNAGVFRFGPRGNLPLMVDGGSYDFFSIPENEVIFDGTSPFQPVPAGRFRNIAFENGSPKTISGDSLKVFGHLFTEVEVRKDPDIFSAGIVLIVGDSDQTIDGDGVGVLENIVVRKSGGELTVLSDFGVNEGLVMQQGIMNANPGIVGIGGNGFIQEGDYSYVIGRVGSERNISQNQNVEFGGMGIRIKPEGANMGPTLVYRVTGQALVPGQIDRYYEIFTTNNTDLDATIEFGYHERELNGAVETDLQVTHRAEPAGDFEVLGGGTYRVSNFVRKTGIDRLGVLSLVPSTMAVNAYPSPFSGDRFTVSFTLSDDDPFVDLRIFDMSGREWAHQTVEGVAGKNNVDFTDLSLPGGTYIVRIVSRNWSGFHYIQKETD